MPIPFLFKRTSRQVKIKWKEAYRRFRLRRAAGLEQISMTDVLRRSQAECEPSKPGALRCLLLRFAGLLAIAFTLPGRILRSRK